MLLLALVIYLILWFPSRLLVITFIPGVASGLDLLAALLLFVVSILFAWLVGFVVNAYVPDGRAPLRRMTDIAGVKMITAFTWLLLAGLFAYFRFELGVDNQWVAMMSPVFLVSLLNSLGVRIDDNRLKEDETGARIVRPPQLERPLVPEELVRVYNWEHEGESYEIRVVIRLRVYEECRKQARVSAKEWAATYVADGICGELRDVAQRLLAVGKTFGTYQEVSFVLTFVQTAITYKSENGEYPKYPVESLVDTEGDCKDVSVLAAALLKTMGYDVALLYVPGHVALGVVGAEGLEGAHVEHDGKEYYYCEMTAAGWKIGELPEGDAGVDVEVHPVPGMRVAA